MTSEVAKKLSNQYIFIGHSITIVLLVLIALYDEFFSKASHGSLYNPTMLSAIFSIIVVLSIGLIWRRLAVNTPDMLPTFFTSVSGFRMLLALFTMFGCYMVVGRDAMTEYIVVFMIFYLSNLSFHAIYFSRINNKYDK